MERFYLLHANQSKEDAYAAYLKKTEDLMYCNEVDEDLITVEEWYRIYLFISGRLENQAYLAIQKTNAISATIDTELAVPSSEFILNDLKRDFPKEELSSLEGYKILNWADVEEQETAFHEKLLQKAQQGICKRHQLYLRQKANRIDIAPIQEIIDEQKEYYLERLYVFHYRSADRKQDYISYFSAVMRRFYRFEFVPSECFVAYKKKFKKPPVYLPPFLEDMYDSVAFPVYLSTMKELNYIKESDLLKKIKDNISYTDYSKHLDYLYQAVFYFKQKNYLSLFPVSKGDNLKKWLFELYLTISYQPESGYYLYQLSKVGFLIADEKEQIRFLEKSYRLGSLKAKKELYEYYSDPIHYDDYLIKRYS